MANTFHRVEPVPGGGRSYLQKVRRPTYLPTYLPRYPDLTTVV